MISKERVKEEIRLAIDDQKYGGELQKHGSFYKSDYIGKELMISFVTGTLCYGLFLLMYIMAKMETLSDQITVINYTRLGILLAASYVIFIAGYMLVTGIIYAIRYHRIHQIASEYQDGLRRIDDMYEQEDTQK